MLLEEGKKAGIELEPMCDTDFVLPITGQEGSESPTGCAQKALDIILQRSSSYYRSLYSTMHFGAQGSQIVNSLKSQLVCGDKAHTSILLAKNGIPTPKTYLAYSPESAQKAIGELGYPCVIKPTIGSWGRLVSRLNDKDSAEAVIESREVLGNAQNRIYYLQKHIEKPGRDIRAVVVGKEVLYTIYRKSANGSQFITNTSSGGVAQKFQITSELEELVLKAVSIVDDGIYGVDLMESKEGGFVVHEINHNIDFRNSMEIGGVNVAEKIVQWLKSQAK